MEYKCVLMENFDRALMLEQTSLESAGSAMQKFDIYQESAAAASQRLTNEFQRMFLEVNDNLIIGFINFLTGVLKVTNALGGLRTILAIIVTLFAVWKVDAITKAVAGLIPKIMALNATLTTTQMLAGGIGLALVALSVAFSLYSAEAEKAKQATIDSTNAFYGHVDSLKELKQNINSETSSRADLINALKGINEEYAKEARLISNINELRDYANEKIDEEAKLRAQSFISSNLQEYEKAVKFFEEGAPINLYVSRARTSSDPLKEITNLNRQILELGAKEALSYSEKVLLQRMQKEVKYLENLKEKYFDLYQAGKLAYEVKNNGLNNAISKTIELQQETDNLIATVAAYANSSESVLTLASSLETLDKVLEKVRANQEMSATEVFKLLEQYPELHTAIIKTADGYTIELKALEDLRKAKILEHVETFRIQKENAINVLRSKGVIIESYDAEIDAIERAITAQIAYLRSTKLTEIALGQHGSHQRTSLYVQTLNDIKALEEARASIRSTGTQLSAAEKMLGMIQSGHAMYTPGTSVADAAKRADDEAKRRAKEAEEAEKRRLQMLETEIKIRMMRLDAERKAVEDSFNQQIDLIKEINKQRQDEIDLITAKERLMNAQAQKVKRVYYEGQGFVYEADKQAIKDSREELRKLETEAEIRRLETARDSALTKQDQRKETYETSLLNRMMATQNEGTRNVIGGALGLTEWKGGWYDKQGQRVFKEGGRANFTGTAWLDGSPNREEIVLNNKQSAGLFNWIKGLQNPKTTKGSLAGAGVGNNYNFYGGLTFPNVRNATDFISDLERLDRNSRN
jgi:hypothetical protein